jgi:hypothetical protein
MTLPDVATPQGCDDGPVWAKVADMINQTPKRSKTRMRLTGPGPFAGAPAVEPGRLSASRRIQLTVMAIACAASSMCMTACSSEEVVAQKGPTPSTSDASSTQVSIPQASSRKSVAKAAAVAQVRAYEKTIDDLALDQDESLDRLYRVSTQPDVTDEIVFLNRFRTSHDRQVGRSRVTAAKVTDLHIGGTYPATATVTICLDVSRVRAFDRRGKSIVPASRKPYYSTVLYVLNRRDPLAQGWLVQKVSTTEKRSCAV